METILSCSTKLLVFQITSLIFLWNIGIYSKKVEDICNLTYYPSNKPQSKNETECGSDPPTLLTMTDGEKILVVNTTNKLRNKIAQGLSKLHALGDVTISCPRAANMQVMQWDNELADAAKKRVMDCKTNILTMDVVKIGNEIQAISIYIHIAVHTDEHMKSTLNEQLLLTAAKSPVSYDYFKILVHHSSLFIGCAMAKIDESSQKARLVCYIAPWNEAEKNNYYQIGLPCSDCPFNDVYNPCDSDYDNLCKRQPWIFWHKERLPTVVYLAQSDAQSITQLAWKDMKIIRA